MATARPVPLGPIETTTTLDAMEQVEAHLLSLLDGITADEWNAPTIVPGWHVRHIAGHLLDTATRKLAIVRDGIAFERPASSAASDVRDFVDRLNAEGVRVYGRLSPHVLRALIAPVSQQLCAYHRALDPFAPAVFPVSWAGEDTSANWFDIARELTERWHHQAQIRLALDRPPLFERELYHPVLDCFIRVLPHAFRHEEAPAGAVISVRIDGSAGGEWHLLRDEGTWLLASSVTTPPLARITLPEVIAWRVFTKGIAREAAEHAAIIEGDRRLLLPVLGAIAIVG